MARKHRPAREKAPDVFDFAHYAPKHQLQIILVRRQAKKMRRCHAGLARTGLISDLRPGRAERVAHVGRPARTPRERTSCWGEGWLRGASRGDTGARRGDAGGRARVKSGFIFPILLFLHHTLSGK